MGVELNAGARRGRRRKRQWTQGQPRGPGMGSLGPEEGHSLPGGRRPLIHHFEKILQQFLPPVEVTKLL